MLNHLEKHRLLISIVLTTVTLATLFLWPAYSRPISTGILLMSMSMAVGFIAQKHRQAYDQAECTREKMTHNLSLDVVGLLFSVTAAILAGGLAGQWAGLRAGLWAGLAAGFLVGFLAAWAVRFAWGRLLPAG